MFGRTASKIIFKLSGWQIKGEIPSDVKQCIAIGVPHTSNWDFLYTVSALQIYGYPAKYLIKDVFFKNPVLGWFMRKTGAIPVDRSKRNNLTGELKQMLESGKPLYILFSPEGTRKKVEKWKSGFYHVAVDCGLPIALGFLDYKNKHAGFLGMFEPTGDKVADFKAMEKYYSSDMACNPDLFNPQFVLREQAD